jgi:hypothetical protein
VSQFWGAVQYLVFSYKRGQVAYSAELTAETDTELNGSYSRGLMYGGSNKKPMRLSK